MHWRDGYRWLGAALAAVPVVVGSSVGLRAAGPAPARAAPPAPGNPVTAFRQDLAVYAYPSAYRLLTPAWRRRVSLTAFVNFWAGAPAVAPRAIRATPQGIALSPALGAAIAAHQPLPAPAPAAPLTGPSAAPPAPLPESAGPADPPADPARGAPPAMLRPVTPWLATHPVSRAAVAASATAAAPSAGTPPTASGPPGAPPPLPTYLAALYAWTAWQTGVPWTILAGQGWVESGWNPLATHVNANGSVDRGLAQINSAAHPAVTPAEAFDPWFAIPWQARLLRRLYAQYGDWPDALAAYNSGAPLGAQPPAVAPQVHAYVTAVLAAAAALAREGSP